MTVESYGKIFRKEYLSISLPLEPFDLNNPYMTPKTTPRSITPQKRFEALKIIDDRAKKSPEIRNEDVKISDDYLMLCEQNNICPIMFLPSMAEGYKKHFNKQILYEFYYRVRQACKSICRQFLLTVGKSRA